MKITEKRIFVVTMLERRNGEFVTRWGKYQNATIVADVMILTFSPLRGLVWLKTFDGGLELAQGSRIAIICASKTSFESHLKNQRVGNENVKGRLRQYARKRLFDFQLIKSR